MIKLKDIENKKEGFLNGHSYRGQNAGKFEIYFTLICVFIVNGTYKK